MAANPQGATRMCTGCGRIIQADYNVCPYCGTPKYAQYGPQPMQQPQPLGSGVIILLYIFSFLIPFVGIIAGIILWGTGNDAERKHVGKICILLGIVSWVFTYLIALLLYALVML